MRQLPRPGAGVAAILTVREGSGISGNTVYNVYIKADKDGSVQEVFSVMDAGPGTTIRWQNPKTLIVHISCGDVMFYTNNSWYPWNRSYEGVFIGLEGNQACEHPRAVVPAIRSN